LIDVKVEMKQYNKLINILENLSKRIKDMRPIWKEFVKYYTSEIVEAGFNTRGKIFGEKWANYSPKYLAWRRKKGFSGGQMLILSGEMKAAAKNPKTKIKKNNLQMLVQDKKAAVHQFGSRKKNIPARLHFAKKDSTIPARALMWLIKRMNKYVQDVEK